MEKRELTHYESDLFADLQDRSYAAEYLTAAVGESREAFLLALRDVVDAQKGMSSVAKEAQVNRENLYKMLSENGNPRLSSLNAVLQALGLRMSFESVGVPRESDERPAQPSVRALR